MSFKLEFKDDVQVKDIKIFTHNCQILFIAFMNYCQNRNVPCKITSLSSDRANVKAVSRTHEEGRAWDASIYGWSKHDIEDCLFHFNTYYKNIAALSASDLKPRAVIHHDNHLHFQVRPQG